MVVGEGQAVAQRRALGEAGLHHQHRHEGEAEQEGAVAPAPRPHEAAQSGSGHQQRGDHHRDREQQRARVVEIGDGTPGEADPDVGQPEAHEPQALGRAGGPPHRPGLLGEVQEADAVGGLDPGGDDPPQRCQHGQGHHPEAEGDDLATADRARPPLIEREQHRPQQHPRRHRAVDATPRRGDEQRDGRRPAPAAGLAQAPVDRQHQPRQRGVGQEGHRGAVRIGDHERVEQDDGTRGQLGGHGGTPEQRDEQPGGADGGQREHRAQPQALDDPVRQADGVPGGEERAHREQVAGLLPGLDVAELARGRPHRRHVGQEAARVDVQVDLGVGGGPARALGEREQERHGAEKRGHARVSASLGHRRGSVSVARRGRAASQTAANA